MECAQSVVKVRNGNKVPGRKIMCASPKSPARTCKFSVVGLGGTCVPGVKLLVVYTSYPLSVHEHKSKVSAKDLLSTRVQR